MNNLICSISLRFEKVTYSVCETLSDVCNNFAFYRWGVLSALQFLSFSNCRKRDRKNPDLFNHAQYGFLSLL